MRATPFALPKNSRKTELGLAEFFGTVRVLLTATFGRWSQGTRAKRSVARTVHGEFESAHHALCVGNLVLLRDDG